MLLTRIIGLISICSSCLITAQSNVFPSSGNVGIGTTNPLEQLQIGNSFTFHNSGHKVLGFLYRPSGGLDLDSSKYAGELRFDPVNGNLRLGTSSTITNLPTTHFTIMNNGNVGIGTMTPNVKLQVKGPIKGDEVIAVETGGSYKVAMNGQSDGYIAGRDNSFIQQFLIRSNGVSFLNGGNVGIGTNQPDSKLTVKGNIHAEEVKVDLAVPGPDYVFKEGYDLRTLEEVQEYIQANGHLPNIPSAKEMKENGVELGTMNMKLLEKIEKLILYTLQQEEKLKHVESLEQELKTQKGEIENLKRLIKNLYE